MTYSENKYFEGKNFTKSNVAISVAFCLLLKIISFVNPKRIDAQDDRVEKVILLGVFASMFELLFLMLWLSDDIVIFSYLYSILVLDFIFAIGMFVSLFVKLEEKRLECFTGFSFFGICLTIVYFAINNAYLMCFKDMDCDLIFSSIVIIFMIGMIIAMKKS